MIDAMKQAVQALQSSQKFALASSDKRFPGGWGEQLDIAESAITALRAAIAAAERAGPVAHVSDAECRLLLLGFMFDCNAIGLSGAAENLHKSIKQSARAALEAAWGVKHAQ